MFCSRCGAQVAEGATFCSACGQRLASFASPGGEAGAAATQGSAIPVPGPPPAWGNSATIEAHTAAQLYAGFWLRVVAAIIDALIMGFAIGIPFAFVVAASGISGAGLNIHPGDPIGAVFAAFGFGLIIALFSVAVVGGWLYFALMESSSWQGTLGKKALGLYVTDIQGNRVTFGRASGRYFGGRFLWHVPAFGLLYGFIDCILAGLSARKQAIHDMIANCLVMRKI